MKVLEKLFKPSGERKRAASEAAAADPVIDRLVRATDQRLAQVSGYRKALRGPVLAARERATAMVARIPGPVEVSPRAWSENGELRPLFVNADEAAAAFSGEEGVRAFFAAHPASDCFGMLALLQAERRVLTTVQQGDLQVEVARTTVSFGEPQVLAPAAGEAEVRAELALRVLEYIALRAMERVGEMRAGRRELERERSLLQAKVRLARNHGAGFGAVAAPEGAGAGGREVLERDLARTVAELEQSASRNLLPALMKELLAALERPEEHLSIEPCALTLDAMNFSVAPGPQAVAPPVATLKLAHRGPFAVLVGRFPRVELRAPVNRLAEAAKYL